MALTHPAAVLAAVLQLLPRVAATSSSSPAIYPYTPTSILVPSSDSSVIYIFSPNDSGQVEFLSLNISTTLSASAVGNITTLTEGVPFLANSGQENTDTTFVPSIRSDGSLFVFAGACASNDSATVWTYSPSIDSSSTAQWISSSISLSDSETGPWFLGASTAFSNQIEPTESNSTFYVYGGMCPTSTTSTTSSAAASSTSITASNWQSLASYSNKMLKLVPSSGKYTPSVVSSKGPPVAQAGFSFTTLTTSVSNHSGVVTQQVTSIVLGGHTETAFVNMSTAAIWSLPEEAWSFVTIANPTSSSSSSTELAVVPRSDSSTSASAPDSRSGHTAVLSEDGNSLVVLGGWVGDVSQAADPQLAILEMGQDYAEWQWSIPSTQPTGGIYGHGAALLPGNVMVVYGGYNISSSTTSTKLIRRDSSSNDDGLMFFNMTSLSWASDYTNPTYAKSLGTSSAPTSSSSYTSSSKIGIGVGLGLGIPLAILILVLVIRSCRRRGRRRRRRDDAVRAIAQDHRQFLNGSDEMIENHDPNTPFSWNPRDALGFYSGGHDPYHSGHRSLGFESLRGAKASPAFPSYSPNMANADDSTAFTNVRKPPRSVARGLYQPTTINDYEPLSATGGTAGAAAGNGTSGIHPIYEDEEEDDDIGTEKGHWNRPVTRGTAGSTGRSISPETEELTDPFMTPTSQSAATASSPFKSPYAGAFAPATVNLNPFVRNTPSPEDGARPRLSHGGIMGADIGDVEESSGQSAKVGQDRDVQEWVTGLEIEDLLFAPPAPGAGAAVAASVSPAPGAARGRVSPANTNHRLSLRSKPSSSSSPTRNSFFGAGTAAAAAAVAGAITGVAGWGAASDEEARTTSNLSDRSAFSFLSRSASARSKLGGAHVLGAAPDPKASSSDTSSASFNTAPSAFHNLRSEGPALLYGKGHRNGSSAEGSSGAASGQSGGTSNNNSSSPSGSLYKGTIPPAVYTLHAPPALPSQGPGPSFSEYGGAASVMASGATLAGPAYPINYGRNQRNDIDEDEGSRLAGSPSKAKGRRTWMGNLIRIFSSGSPANSNTRDEALADETGTNNSMGTGAQQDTSYQNMAHATLLRRKQGRSDWEADESREEEATAVGAIRNGGRAASLSSVHGYSLSHGAGGPATAGVAPSGSVAAGRREGSGKSDDWDVEKAVQNRVVQVMFTMPRDQQLRVVNAEVERDEDETDIANLNPTRDQHDYHTYNNDDNDLGLEKRNHDHDDELDLGGLSAPPPPPVLQRPYQSYRSQSPLSNTAAKAAVDNEQYRAMPPPPELAALKPDLIDRQDEQLRQLHEALAESKRLLSSQAIEPWMLDARDDYDDDDAVSFGAGGAHEDQAQAVPLNKGKVVDVGWMDGSSVPSPLNTSSAAITPPVKRKRTAEEEERLATAAALARTFMSRPGLQKAGPVSGPVSATVNAAPSTSTAKSPSAREIPPPRAPSPAKMATPTTPTRAPRHERSRASLKTPTKAVSMESLSSNNTATSSLRSGKSKCRAAPVDDVLQGSPVAVKTIKKPAGFVLDMIDRIETGSPKSQ